MDVYYARNTGVHISNLEMAKISPTGSEYIRCLITLESSMT
ncbi:MAG: hypothetical protein ACI9VT_000556 [Psychroserpens sp.]|jgi:hypothetical protein